MTHSSFQPGEIVDGYEIVRQIGVGGFGTVWLCRVKSIGGFRALKHVTAADTEILEKERHALVRYRQAASQLRSPHLMPIEHVNSNESGLFYVMPLADGLGAEDPVETAWRPLTLAALVDARRHEGTWFGATEITAIVAPLLEGLQTLMEAGLVHRDVKPDNILFLDGQPCLADISLLGEDDHLVSRRGTPGYSAPSWYVDAGGHADMYGVAATLHTILTGHAPDKMGRPHFRWPPQGEASLSVEEHKEWLRLHRIILRATEERPTNRFLHYNAFKEALGGGPEDDATEDGEQLSPSQKPSKETRPAFGGSRIFPVLSFALAVLGLLGTLGALRIGFADGYVPIAAILFPSLGLVAGIIGLKASRLRDLNIAAVLLNVALLLFAIFGPSALGIAVDDFEPALLDQSKPIVQDPSPSGLTEAQKADYKTTASLAAIYFTEKNYQSALDLINQLLETYPIARTIPLYSTLRAQCLFALGRKDDAHKELKASLTSDARDTASFGQRMELWEALGDLDGAEKEATRMIEHERPVTLYYLLRAKIRLMQGDFEGVEADIHSASTLDNDPARTGMDDTLRSGFADDSPAYAKYLAAKGIRLPEKSVPKVTPSASLDSVLQKYDTAVQDFATTRVSLKKEASGIFESLSKAIHTFDGLKKHLAELGALIGKAETEAARGDATYREFLATVEPLKKSSAEADGSPDGWKTARKYDEKFAVLNNALLSVSGWLGQDISDWTSTMQGVFDRAESTLAKQYEKTVNDLSKSSDSDAPDRIATAQKKMSEEQDRLRTLFMKFTDGL